jgi:putative tryptophan/tyrosine transport system substrate-binding protein
MRRRDFIAGIGGATAWLPAYAQQRERLPLVGLLGASTPAAQGQLVAVFIERLRALGWSSGRTVAIETRWAEGRTERFAEIAAEFVRLNVDIIVTTAPAVPTLKRATATIPIVFVFGLDPVGSGVVASLARPGGNVTGLSNQGVDLASKRLQLLREVVPGLRRLAIMANVENAGNVLGMQEVETSARNMGIDPIILRIRHPEDIAPAFDGLKGRADALYISVDALMTAQNVRIHTLASSARLPTCYSLQEMVETGGLMAYGPSRTDQYRRAAEIVDKILRGTKPADIPVEQATKLELVLNLTTAKALGVTIPGTLLATADEVIQ